MDHTDRTAHIEDREMGASTPNHTYDTDAHEVWTTGAVEWVNDAHDHW